MSNSETIITREAETSLKPCPWCGAQVQEPETQSPMWFSYEHDHGCYMRVILQTIYQRVNIGNVHQWNTRYSNYRCEAWSNVEVWRLAFDEAIRIFQTATAKEVYGVLLAARARVNLPIPDAVYQPRLTTSQPNITRLAELAASEIEEEMGYDLNGMPNRDLRAIIERVFTGSDSILRFQNFALEQANKLADNQPQEAFTRGYQQAREDSKSYVHGPHAPDHTPQSCALLEEIAAGIGSLIPKVEEEGGTPK